MKKIVFITQELQLGGAEVAILMLANSLAEQGFEIVIYSAMKTSYILKPDRRIQIVILTSFDVSKDNKFLKPIRKIIELRSVKRIISEIHDSIIITPRDDYNIILSKYAAKDNKRIAWLHNDYTPKMLEHFKTKYSGIDYFIQLTDQFVVEIENAIRPSNKNTKIVKIPNFILQREKRNCERENYVIAVGGLHQVKGFDRLINIWASIFKKYPNWKLIIAGTGEEKKNLERKIKQLGLSTTVSLLGFISNSEVRSLMDKGKIFALSSYKEGFSIVTVEAMQSGLPVVAFDVRTGPRTIITNERDGFLITDGDENTYATKLDLLIQDESLRNSMSNNAYEKSKMFVKDNVIKKWMDILSK